MEEAVNRCARCEMRAPAGAKFCRACRRATGAAGDDGEPSPARRLGARQYVALALLGGLVALLGAAAVADALRAKPTRNAYVEPVAAGSALVPSAAPARVADEAPPDRDAEARAAYEARYAAAKPPERAEAVRACVLGAACGQAQLDGIIAAGAHEREREELRRLSHAWGAHAVARSAADGEQISSVAVAAVAMQLEQCGLAELKKLDWTTHGEADKDIDAARGKMMNMYGAVQQIRRDGDVHHGTMTTSSGWAYFVAVGGTKGVISGRHAELAGLVIQRYLYDNAAGGLTDSILVVGRFRGQHDNDRPLPTLPRQASTGSAPSPLRSPPAPATASAPSAAAPETQEPARRPWSGVLDEAPVPSPPPATPEPAAAPSAAATGPT